MHYSSWADSSSHFLQRQLPTTYYRLGLVGTFALDGDCLLSFGVDFGSDEMKLMKNHLISLYAHLWVLQACLPVRLFQVLSSKKIEFYFYKMRWEEVGCWAVDAHWSRRQKKEEENVWASWAEEPSWTLKMKWNFFSSFSFSTELCLYPPSSSPQPRPDPTRRHCRFTFLIQQTRIIAVSIVLTFLF